MGCINEPHNIIGLSHLMKDESGNPDINIDELEKNIINGERDIHTEEIDLVSQYKNDMQRLSKKFGVSLSDNDSGGDILGGDIFREKDTSKFASIWGDKQSGQSGQLQHEPSFKRDLSFGKSAVHGDKYSNRDGDYSNRDGDYSNRDGDYSNRDGDYSNRDGDYSNHAGDNSGHDGDGLRPSYLDNYKFSTPNGTGYAGESGSADNVDDTGNNGYFQDPHLRNMTQEQQKRNHLQQVFKTINSKDRAPLGNYDLMADRDHEDKQMLLSEIEELREDLQQIGIDISHVKEVDNNSSLSDIQAVRKKLIYKNNSNNYSTFADDVFILGAQTAEYLFDGDKEWFGHKPDLTGWSTTIRGKLRRMRYTKTRIIRKIIDDYQIPDWLQIGIEIVPSAFTHSRHRKSAVKDSVVNNATYQNAIHDLNNIVN